MSEPSETEVTPMRYPWLGAVFVLVVFALLAGLVAWGLRWALPNALRQADFFTGVNVLAIAYGVFRFGAIVPNAINSFSPSGALRELAQRDRYRERIASSPIYPHPVAYVNLVLSLLIALFIWTLIGASTASLFLSLPAPAYQIAWVYGLIEAPFRAARMVHRRRVYGLAAPLYLSIETRRQLDPVSGASSSPAAG